MSHGRATRVLGLLFLHARQCQEIWWSTTRITTRQASRARMDRGMARVSWQER